MPHSNASHEPDPTKPAPVETLYEGRFLRLVKQGKWEYVERTKVTGVVGVAAVTPEGKLILTEQFRIPVGRFVIELPAGLAGDVAGEESEPLSAAARRELLEETGYEAHGMQPLVEAPSSAGLTNETMTLFLATDLRRTGPGGGDGSENIVVHEQPLEGIDLWLASQAAAGRLIDAKVYAALYFLGAKRG